VPPAIASSEFAATSPEILSIVCADITLNPNQPTERIHRAQREEGNRRRRVRRNPAFPRVPARAARRAAKHRHQRDPPAHRMDDHRAGEVVNSARTRLEPGLGAVVLVPGDALEERVDEADQQEGRGELRIEARALGDCRPRRSRESPPRK